MKIKCYGINCSLFKEFKIKKLFNNIKSSFPDCKKVTDVCGFVNLKDGVYSTVAGRASRNYYVVYKTEIYFLFNSFLEYSKEHYITQGHSNLCQVKDYHLRATSVQIKAEQLKRSKEYDEQIYKQRRYFSEPNLSQRLKSYKMKKNILIKSVSK